LQSHITWTRRRLKGHTQQKDSKTVSLLNASNREQEGVELSSQ